MPIPSTLAGALAPLMAVAGEGDAIFMAAIIVFLLAVVYGIYTRLGSGIDQHPLGEERHDAQPGAAHPSRLDGRDDTTGSEGGR